MQPTKTEQAYELINRIRYQCSAPSVTTMGNCANQCGRMSRGARECAECLGQELAKLIQPTAAFNLVLQLRLAQQAVYAAETGAEVLRDE